MHYAGHSLHNLVLPFLSLQASEVSVSKKETWNAPGHKWIWTKTWGNMVSHNYTFFLTCSQEADVSIGAAVFFKEHLSPRL